MKIYEIEYPGEGQKVKFVSDSGQETEIDLKEPTFFSEREVQKTFL